MFGNVGGGSTQVTALGLGRVVEVTRNGRGRVEYITDPSEMKAVLEELGYPDLMNGVNIVSRSTN